MFIETYGVLIMIVSAFLSIAAIYYMGIIDYGLSFMIMMGMIEEEDIKMVRTGLYIIAAIVGSASLWMLLLMGRLL